MEEIVQIITGIVSIAAIVLSIKSYKKSIEAIDLTQRAIKFSEDTRRNNIRPFFEIRPWNGAFPELINNGGDAYIKSLDEINPKNWIPFSVKPSLIKTGDIVKTRCSTCSEGHVEL